MPTEKPYKKIIILDSAGNDIGVASYGDAIANDAIRSAARVMLRNEKGEFLISRRSKYISKPLLLDNSAAGHRDEGETYEETAYRELKEELGVDDLELRKVASVVKGINFFYSLFVADVSLDVSIDLNPHEVAEVLWMSPEEIDVLVSDRSSECSPDFVDMWTSQRNILV